MPDLPSDVGDRYFSLAFEIRFVDSIDRLLLAYRKMSGRRGALEIYCL